MTLIRGIGTLRTLSFAVGVVLGLVSAASARSSADKQFPAHPPEAQFALDQWPMAGHRCQPTAAETDRRIDACGAALGAPWLANEYREVQQLYDEIMRQTDPALRPWAFRP
jgi:hypothetical protein